MGFTGSSPHDPSFRLTECEFMCWVKNDQPLLYISGVNSVFNSSNLCGLGFDIEDLKKGQSLGILLTKGQDFHWFLDNKHKGFGHVPDYPLDRPMWGVVDLFGRCDQVRAEICTGEFGD